jgi:hypothetical protein
MIKSPQSSSYDAPGRDPEHTRGCDGIDSPSFPPGDFVSEAVVVAVMASAQRHRELAPIQVTAWGKATGTGLPTIDCSPIPSRVPNRYAISSRSRSLIFRARSLSSRLRKIRHELPDLIDGCCSPAAYTRAVEEAYRTMWEKYCGGQTTAWSTYNSSQKGLRTQMTQADSVLSRPPTNTSAIDHPMFPPRDTTRRFETLKDAEDTLMEQGFKLVPDTCNWINDTARIDAGVHPVEEARGVSKYQIEYRAPDATPTRRRFLAVAAVASVAGASSLTAATLAPNVPRAVTTPKHSRPDPAFVLIADKLAGDIAHCEAIDAEAEAEEHGVGLDEAYDRCSAACHAVNAIDWKLATTLPTTLAGVAAVLRFANEIEDAGMEWPNTDAIGPDGWIPATCDDGGGDRGLDQGPGRKGGAVMTVPGTPHTSPWLPIAKNCGSSSPTKSPSVAATDPGNPRQHPTRQKRNMLRFLPPKLMPAARMRFSKWKSHCAIALTVPRSRQILLCMAAWICARIAFGSSRKCSSP